MQGTTTLCFLSVQYRPKQTVLLLWSVEEFRDCKGYGLNDPRVEVRLQARVDNFLFALYPVVLQSFP